MITIFYYSYFFVKGNDKMKKNNTNFYNYPSFDKSHLPRTDLACEVSRPTDKKSGTALREYMLCGIPVSELYVTDSEGERTSGKRIGRYSTLHTPIMRCLCREELFSVTEALSALITSFTEKAIGKTISKTTRVLVAGLGNRFISADSIGPRAADKIAVTGHMANSDSRELFELIGCASLSAVHPGVMGQTGIEAAVMIKGAADHVHPDVIIAVDALAARSTSRLACTIQLTDTGIEPGSGIGNRRCAVDERSMGCPVIAIGVPTVVDCATLVYDALERAGVEGLDESFSKALEKERGLFVSLRDSDIVSEEISAVIAGAINRAFLAEGL